MEKREHMVGQLTGGREVTQWEKGDVIHWETHLRVEGKIGVIPTPPWTTPLFRSGEGGEERG